VVELRRAWKAELDKLVARGKVSDDFIKQLNHLLAEDIFHETLHRMERLAFTSTVRPLDSAERSSPSLRFPRQIAYFLAEANVSYLHRCANTTSCVLYFYDTTKNHRRQWCSTAGCGNRHKVAEFRKRQVKSKK
jgi:predicted RNA-binding Zn ribbon-like protein